MSSHSPSRRPSGRGHEKGQSSSRNRRGSSIDRRSNTRDYHTPPRRRSRSPVDGPSDRFPPEKRKSPKKSTERIESSRNIPSDKTSNSSRRSTIPLNERKREGTNSPGRSYRGKSSEDRGDKPIFRGPEEGSTKFDIGELKRITVKIQRSLPKKEKVDIQRTIINPETITPVRRPDEGSRPIFARPELMAGTKDDMQEHRRVGTRRSIENDLHLKRKHSESPHGSHKSDCDKRNPSSYDGKRRRSHSPVDKNHRYPSRGGSREGRHRDDRHSEKAHSSRRSRSRSHSHHADKELKRYSKERERVIPDNDGLRSKKPSSNKRHRSRSSSREKHRDDGRERRRRDDRQHRDIEERRPRRDLAMDEYRDQTEPNELYHLHQGDGYEFPRPRGGVRGVRPFHPIRPVFIAPPMMGYRPPPPGHCLPPVWVNRPGFRPPRPPPYAARFPPPY